MQLALRVSSVFASGLLLSALTFAQLNTGSISSTVLDASQVAVPNATVTALPMKWTQWHCPLRRGSVSLGHWYDHFCFSATGLIQRRLGLEPGASRTWA